MGLDYKRCRKTRKLLILRIARLLDFPPETARMVEVQLTALDQLAAHVETIEDRIRTEIAPTTGVQLLRTAPGVGEILAPVIALEIGDVRRFPHAENLASYAGLVPRVFSSGGHTRLGGISRFVNQYLKWAFVEAANCAVRLKTHETLTSGASIKGSSPSADMAAPSLLRLAISPKPATGFCASRNPAECRRQKDLVRSYIRRLGGCLHLNITASATNAYSKRSASSGLMEAAFLEGRIEKARFSIAEARKARSALRRSKTNGNRTASLIQCDVGQERTIPRSPPASASASVSQITCRKMSAAVAPRARRVPISRVLSLTAIQVMATIPKPETASALAPIHRRRKPSR